MNEERTYPSPAAFRRALTDKLKAKAESSRWSLQQLQRQMAYDRLLERLYLVDEGWIVKGATALLARDIGVRGTIDIDVYRRAARDIADSELRESAALDIGDWFRFEVGPSRPVADGAIGVRIPVTAYVGATAWAGFHVDIVGEEVRMTGEPEDVPALARVAMPQVEQHGYRAYPLVDHIADKVAATFDRYGSNGHPSTRFRDLVDLVAIVIGASVDAGAQMRALESEAERRGFTLPQRFDVPDRELWEPGYAAEARRSLLPLARTSTMLWASSGHFSTRSSTDARAARGIRQTDAGPADAHAHLRGVRCSAEWRSGSALSRLASPTWQQHGRSTRLSVGPERTSSMTRSASSRLAEWCSTCGRRGAATERPASSLLTTSGLRKRSLWCWNRRSAPAARPSGQPDPPTGAGPPAARQAGVPWATPHAFRHGLASLMAEHGYSPAQIAVHLGHADGGVLALRTYIHAEPISAADFIADALTAST